MNRVLCPSAIPRNSVSVKTLAKRWATKPRQIYIWIEEGALAAKNFFSNRWCVNKRTAKAFEERRGIRPRFDWDKLKRLEKAELVKRVERRERRKAERRRTGVVAS